MILLVLVFHSGASYGSFVAFWPFHEANPSEFVDILMLLGDVFMMTILFFIAGYFALPSLQRKGGKQFLKGKFKRLGIPWLIVTLSVLPILDYIHYYTQSIEAGLKPQGYGRHWFLSVKKIAEFYVGRMRMSEYLNMTEHFYQRYMWFLSLLLLFFLIFWIIFAVTKKWGWFSANPAPEKASSNRSVYIALALVGLLFILLFTAVKLFVSSPANPFDMVWFSVGNLIQFEFAKLAFYIPGFGLGVYAFSKKWFMNGPDFGRPRVWGGIVFLLMIINMLVGRAMTRTALPSLGLQIAFLVLYPLWTLSFLGLFTAFASRRWNSSSTFNHELALNSYNMYLVHYGFVMTMPLILSTWVGGPVLVKFGIVALSTIVLSYAFSRYLIQPFSRLVVVGLTGLNVLLVLIT